MYHHGEAERLLEQSTGDPQTAELRAIGHALLAVADAIRDAGRIVDSDDDPIPFRIEGRRLPTANGGV